ncbi:MAG: SDR family oxidoreductase [Pyrinomonadaceae bacterium]|nr:SDR family oxidoreductase [Pyrinomonadaceae bacterium]
MDLGLKGKVALVAAASKGLGKAVAEELANEGVSLILCARDSVELQKTCDEIREKSKVPVLGITTDLGKSEEIEKLYQSGMDEFGQIDILVTNVGGPPAGIFENLSRQNWENSTNLLLTSVLDLTRLVLPQMKERGWGRILNITSIASKQPVDNLILSNSLRAAVTGFAKTLANEIAPFGITVNNILPGYTRTERVIQLAETIAQKEGITPEEATSRWTSEIPMKRLGEPHEFAALAAFLVSERASYITGSSIAVDGGWIKSLF